MTFVISAVLSQGTQYVGSGDSSAILLIASSPYYLAIIVFFFPNLSLTWRRMHDIGRSGWSIMINLIPVIGNIAFLIRLLTAGDTYPNSYGSPPDVAIREERRSEEIKKRIKKEIKRAREEESDTY